VQKQRWAVVLAAGSGTRLQKMTCRGDGLKVPKQYCSMHGGPSLLRLALARAYTVVPRDRVLCVVATEHEQWWRRELADLPEENIIVQPMNRGTAIGTLLPLLVARSRDPSPRLIFLPADHYFEDEHVLASGISAAFDALDIDGSRVLLLGFEPDEPDTGLGYILSGKDGRGQVRQVQKFVEKPPIRRAKTMMRKGALWNSFVFASQGMTLLNLLHRKVPEAVQAFDSVITSKAMDSKWSEYLPAIYRNLATTDLSRAVFQGAENDLAVLRVPSCGWTDLGTPERVARYLTGSADSCTAIRPPYPYRPTHVDLASAFLSTCH